MQVAVKLYRRTYFLECLRILHVTKILHSIFPMPTVTSLPSASQPLRPFIHPVHCPPASVAHCPLPSVAELVEATAQISYPIHFDELSDRIIFQSYKLWPRTMPQTSFKTFSQGQPCFKNGTGPGKYLRPISKGLTPAVLCKLLFR